MLLHFLLAVLPVLCSCWRYGVSENLVVDREAYRRLNPHPSTADRKFLTSLSRAKLSHLSTDVSVIDLGAPVDLHGVLRSHVFVRSLYTELLSTVRASRRTVLIGNPGTSTSFFQYYYLARLLNPQLFEALTPDWKGSSANPKVVVRQNGNDDMTVYDLTAGTADTIHSTYGRLLTCFDPNSTIYLHEPYASIDEPLNYNHKVPILSTVSPDQRRYKEFVKSGAAQVFMPAYTLEELLVMGGFIQAEGAAPRDVSYSPRSIKERFDRYGGIFRHVLPAGMASVRSSARELETALMRANAGMLLQSGDIEQPGVSPMLAQYKVLQEGRERFYEYSVDIASEHVRRRLQRAFNKCSLAERVETLVRSDETGFMETVCRELYASVVADSLTVSRGVAWRQRRARFSSTQASGWEALALEMKRVERDETPLYTDMEEGVIYHPAVIGEYPIVDFLFKTSAGTLVGVLVARAQSEAPVKIRTALVLDLLERVGLSAGDVSKLQLVLVPRPGSQETAALTLVRSKRAQTRPDSNTSDPLRLNEDASTAPAAKDNKQKEEKQEKRYVLAAELGLQEYTVWGVPPDYARTWARFT